MLALYEFCFQLVGTKKEVTIPFQLIAQNIGLNKDEVETLLIYTLSTELVHGRIVGDEETFKLSHVKPRLLDKQRMLNLKSKLAEWRNHIQQTYQKITSY